MADPSAPTGDSGKNTQLLSVIGPIPEIKPAKLARENLLLYSSTLRYTMLGFIPASLLYLFAQQSNSGYMLLSIVAALIFMLYPPPVLGVLNPIRDGINQAMSLDYKLNEGGYIAIKSDEMGVIDIAFQQHHAAPKWILGNHTSPFQGNVSVIRCAYSHNLRIIRDVWRGTVFLQSISSTAR
ncbi:predicted protein [Uncinocarpus reesii 1704]|uniref:Uncharacterized protein n=1 Tax=Uncinocarpus reesii (strain UAMH 1704) TaxID=336963 RepID=C4JX46_UNCRE|nr:uncharacterized protein UREG_06219 [Uncinocarpus reesii 1704]EEP81354.1 predicted protein [Uncinocarpus reesii 1704]